MQRAQNLARRLQTTDRFEQRGDIEGHAAGITDLAGINAFAAAGMASDHEAWTPDEVRDKLRRAGDEHWVVNVWGVGYVLRQPGVGEAA